MDPMYSVLLDPAGELLTCTNPNSVISIKFYLIFPLFYLFL